MGFSLNGKQPIDVYSITQYTINSDKASSTKQSEHFTKQT